MSKNNQIWNLTLLLILIICAILYLGVSNLNINLNNQPTNKQSNVTNNYLEITSTTTKPTNRVIVSDRFTGTLQKDANVVVVGEDGSIHKIEEGVVLIDGVLVEAQDNSYQILRVNSPQNFVQTE